jgi:hypothetical protein
VSSAAFAAFAALNNEDERHHHNSRFGNCRTHSQHAPVVDTHVALQIAVLAGLLTIKITHELRVGGL